MDMYQKRKMRQEKNVKKSEEQELNNKMNINWARRNLAKPTSNLHKISVFAIRIFAYLDKEYKKTKQIYQK